MKCECCPHMAAIKKALKPCQTCEAGQLHGQVHVDAHSVDWALKNKKIDDHTATDGVTLLNPDVEDSMRKFVAALFSLDPVELLLVQHVLNGRSYASFAEPMFKMSKRLRTKELELNGKKAGFRQLAKTWADSAERKIPQLHKFFAARIDSDLKV